MTNKATDTVPTDALGATLDTLKRKVSFLTDKYEKRNNGSAILRNQIEQLQWVIDLIELNSATLATSPKSKSFHAAYRWQGGWGTFREIDAIVVAENEPSALVKVLAEYPGTNPDDWIILEVDTAIEGVIHIVESNN